MGELNAAPIDCNESLRLKPDVANTIDSRALIQFKLGEFDKAIANYDVGAQSLIRSLRGHSMGAA